MVVKLREVRGKFKKRSYLNKKYLLKCKGPLLMQDPPNSKISLVGITHAYAMAKDS